MLNSIKTSPPASPHPHGHSHPHLHPHAHPHPLSAQVAPAQQPSIALPLPSAVTSSSSSSSTTASAAPVTPTHNGNESADDDFADLGVDDDDLLGLGNDFNILEYADPELQLDCGGPGDLSGKGRVSAAEGEAEDFNILEYADPDLDTGDENCGSRKNLLEEHLALADEVSKKEAEENAAKVAQGVSEFQAKLLEFTEKQQNLAVNNLKLMSLRP